MEFFMEYLHHRSQAVRGAGRIGNDIVLFRIIGVFIDPHYDGGIVIFAGSRDDDFFHGALDMLAGAGLILQLTRGFYHDFYAVPAPVQVFRIPVMEYMDPFTFDDEVVAVDFYFLAETAVDGIILQKIGSCFHAAGVVDGHHFQVIPVQHAPEYQSSDSAKSVNTNFCHVSTLLFLTLFQPSKIRFLSLRLHQ